MNIIRSSNNQILKMLGNNEPKTDSNSFRFLKYLIISDIDNGKAIYNCLTCSLIWLDNREFINILTDISTETSRWLWDNYFIVNDDFDEALHTENLKKWLRPNPEHESYLSSGNITEFTIFTTTACNARCFYCYERGRQQKPMKADTARKVADYIITNAAKTGKDITLSWFGGEPLVNEKVIDIICQKVQDAGFNYRSSMISNGFLFKEKKLDKYINLWKLKSCQITIDGTEEVYNKTKNYKNIKGKNPFRIIIDNIKFLIKNGIHIGIRINIDNYNLSDVKTLIYYLYNEFELSKHNKAMSIYCWPIFEEYDYHRTDEENKMLYQGLKEIDDILHELGIYGDKELPGDIRYTHCMIDNGHAVLIGTDGDIGLCEHYSEDNFWGHIDDPSKKDMDMIKSFMEYMEPTEICKDCPLVPQCLRPKKCLDLKYCSTFIKDWHIREYKSYLSYTYHIAKQRSEANKLNEYKENKHNEYLFDNNEEQKPSLLKKILIKFGLK